MKMSPYVPSLPHCNKYSMLHRKIKLMHQNERWLKSHTHTRLKDGESSGNMKIASIIETENFLSTLTDFNS